MSVTYNGSHSIVFIESYQSLSPGNTLTEYNSIKHTWDDFYLIPQTRPFIETPEANITMYNDTVSNKVFDVTDAVAGGQTFNSRKGTWEFYIDHDKWDNWYTAKDTIEDYINGKRLYCFLMDDPTTLYYGRFTLSNWEDGTSYSSISIEYDLDFYTYKIEDMNIPVRMTAEVLPNMPKVYIGSNKNIIKPYIKATVYYSNNSQSDNISINDIPGIFEFIGNQDIDISYTQIGLVSHSEYTIYTTVNINVESMEINTIEAVYKESEHNIYINSAKNILLDYINIIVTFNNGYTQTIDGHSAEPLYGLFDTIGNQYINITYSGKRDSIEVNVLNKIDRISASWKNNSQPEVYVSELKDIVRQYININVIYANGEMVILDGSNASQIPGSFSKSTYEYITIIYGSKSCKLLVTITDDSSALDYIELSWKDGTEPTIYAGQPKDMVRRYISITATYMSGRKEYDIDGRSANQVSGNFENSGLQSVSLTYKNKSASIGITILDMQDVWNDVKQSIIRGTYSTDYPIGTAVPLFITGENNTLDFIVSGIDLDTDENGNTIPLTFIANSGLKEQAIYDTYDHSTSYGYEQSSLRNTVLAYYSKMPLVVQNMIVPAKKTFTRSQAYYTGELVDPIWPPSVREIFGEESSGIEYESSGPIYNSRFIDDESRKILNTDNIWWTRSVSVSYGSIAYCVYKGTKVSSSLNGKYYIVLGFCVGNPNQ